MTLVSNFFAQGIAREVRDAAQRLRFAADHHEMYQLGVEPGGADWLARRVLAGFERCCWRFMRFDGGATYIAPCGEDQYESLDSPGTMLSSDAGGPVVSIRMLLWWQHHGCARNPQRCADLLEQLVDALRRHAERSEICLVLTSLVAPRP